MILPSLTLSNGWGFPQSFSEAKSVITTCPGSISLKRKDASWHKDLIGFRDLAVTSRLGTVAKAHREVAKAWVSNSRTLAGMAIIKLTHEIQSSDSGFFRFFQRPDLATDHAKSQSSVGDSSGICSAAG